MAEESERVQLVKAIGGQVKDILIVIASVATIWIQAQNSGKLDVAAAKTDDVKDKLVASSLERDAKLDTIVKHAVGADKKIEDWRTAYERPKSVGSTSSPQE